MGIETLITDVYKVIEQEGWENALIRRGVSEEISKRLQGSAERSKRKGQLGLSQMGPRCPRALWYSVHRPDLAEALPPPARFKYVYGHIIEAVAITLAREAGHQVEGEQDAVVVEGITGHRDCVIDGCVVDVKSCSSMALDKLKRKTIATDDPFGYLEQIDGYVVGSYDDPLVQVKDRGYLWGIDKVLGRMVLYEHRVREDHIKSTIQRHRRIVERDTPPACQCGTVPDGKSGNIKLDVRASYEAFKYQCNPSIRTFIYSDGPRYLTHVERVPDVPEVRTH